MKLSGKVALLTASTKGLGFAIATEFVKQGCSVMVCSRQRENIEKAVAQLKTIAPAEFQVHSTVCDVDSPSDLQRVVQETVDLCGKLDILVPHASAPEEVFNQDIMEVTDDQWDQIFNGQAKFSWRIVQYAVPHLKKTGGRIVFIADMAVYNSPSYLGLYTVAKTSVLALAKSFAAQLGSDGIRVNCIAPGPVSDARFYNSLQQNEDLLSLTLARVPLGRLGKSVEIAKVAAFLASDESSYVSGESLVVGGGAVAHF